MGPHHGICMGRYSASKVKVSTISVFLHMAGCAWKVTKDGLNNFGIATNMVYNQCNAEY